MKMYRKNVLLSLTVSAAILPMTVGAATYYVAPPPTGDDGNAGTSAAPFATIQRALDAVTTGNCRDDTKIIIAAGTYEIDSELTPTPNTDSFGIESVSGDPSDVTIDAQGLSRCFNCTSTHSLSFKGITFINGSASGNGGGVLATKRCSFDDCVFRNCSATGDGGAVCVKNDTVGLKYLRNVMIEGCSATSNGGGVYATGYSGAALTDADGMSNCRIYNCSAGGCGGGMYLQGTVLCTVSECDVSCNTASGAASGGGIYAQNTAISNCTVTNNVCAYASDAGTGGSGIRLNLYGTIDGCLIKDNSFTYDCSAYNGGGSAVYLATGNGASLVNSAIIGNSGSRAVGLQMCNCGGILVSNCLFKSNEARRADGTGRGGILHCSYLNADSLITDCRFLGNQAAGVGGFIEMVLNSGSKDATLRIRNCLMSGNEQAGRWYGMVYASSGTSATANRLALENCTFVSNTLPDSPVISPYVENANYTSTNFVSVSGCAILFNNGKNAFDGNFKTSANVTYNCTEMSGMSEGNITYDSTKPLFEDMANGNFRPAKNSQLCDVVPAAAWMGDGSKHSTSRDLGTGYEIRTAGTYGVDVVWTDTVPRLYGNKADIGCGEYYNPSGFMIIVR